MKFNLTKFVVWKGTNKTCPNNFNIQPETYIKLMSQYSYIGLSGEILYAYNNMWECMDAYIT